MEVELRLFINLHAQTPLDSCSFEVAQRKNNNTQQMGSIKLCRCGNSGNCVTVSVLIGLSTIPCCGPGQSKPRSSIYISAMRRLISVCRPFHWKNYTLSKNLNLAHQQAFLSLSLHVVFAVYMILRNTVFIESIWVTFPFGLNEDTVRVFFPPSFDTLVPNHHSSCFAFFIICQVLLNLATLFVMNWGLQQ